MLPLVVQPTAGTPLAFLGTLVAGWLFFTFTAQIAATFVLGDVPWKRAAAVGAVPAAVTLLLGRFSPLVIIPVAVGADFVAVHLVYRVRYRTAALVAVVHYAASVALVVLAATVLALVSTAPG